MCPIQGLIRNQFKVTDVSNSYNLADTWFISAALHVTVSVLVISDLVPDLMRFTILFELYCTLLYAYSYDNNTVFRTLLCCTVLDCTPSATTTAQVLFRTLVYCTVLI